MQSQGHVCSDLKRESVRRQKTGRWLHNTTLTAQMDMLLLRSNLLTGDLESAFWAVEESDCIGLHVASYCGLGRRKKKEDLPPYCWWFCVLPRGQQVLPTHWEMHQNSSNSLCKRKTRDSTTLCYHYPFPNRKTDDGIWHRGVTW